MRPCERNLSEPIALLRMLHEAGVELVNLTCGSPYYSPHIQRPAIFPPSDGYQPPEDPLVGVARQIQATAEIKQQLPELTLVGSGYTYLQEFLPLVAQAVVRQGWSTSSVWDAWCCLIQACLAMRSPVTNRLENLCAEPSATVLRRRGTASSVVATRWTSITNSYHSGRIYPFAKQRRAFRQARGTQTNHKCDRHGTASGLIKSCCEAKWFCCAV